MPSPRHGSEEVGRSENPCLHFGLLTSSWGVQRVCVCKGLLKKCAKLLEGFYENFTRVCGFSGRFRFLVVFGFT